MTDTIERLRQALSGRYELQHQIGEGGMATVFLALDPKHNREVAIKALKPELSATIGTERFNREIEIAARLQHPHILPVYDSGAADGVLYYVMPYVKGESLKELITREGVTTSDALRIAREVASALDYAHREGVVHRDIKPANILISQGHAVVADFGIARAVSGTVESSGEPGAGLTQVGMTVGTPWYMSPEQATADPNVDGRSDIYALACVLYEMLEGRPPFDGPTAQAVIAQTISAPVPEMADLAGQIPPSVPDAIRRALAKNPDDRFETAGAFGNALDISTGDFTKGAPPPVRSRGMTIAAAAVLVLVAVVGFLVRGTGGTVAAGADVIAVLPFEVSGVGDELGEGMVSLLSTNLNAFGAIRTVDARTVLQRWRARGGEDGLDLAGSIQVGRDAEAGSLILGSIVSAGAGVRLTAEMYTTEGKELARVRLDGDADDVLQLVDSLSLEIVRAIWTSKEPLPSFDVAAITSGSLEAVRAYMRGALHLRMGEWDSAVVALQEAVDIDTSFAMAYLALTEAYGWTGRHGTAVQAEAVEHAARFAERLPPREQLLVSAYRLNRQQDVAAIDSIRAYTVRYPTDPSGWYALGDFQHHLRPSLASAVRLEPFDRAIALDSSMVAALIHPIEISLVDGNRDLFVHYRDLNVAAGGDDRGMTLVAQSVWGNDDEARQAIDSMAMSGTAIQIAVGAALAGNPARVPNVVEAVERRIDGTPNSIANYGYLVAMASMAVGQLDPVTRRAAAMMEWEGRGGIRIVGALVEVLAVLGGIAEPAYAADAPSMFAEQTEGSGQFVAALIQLAEGDPSGARALTGPATDSTGRAGHVIAAMNGWASLVEGDTARGIAELRTALDSLPPGTMGGDQIPNGFRYQLAVALTRDPLTRDEGIALLRGGLPLVSAPEMYPAKLLALAEALEAKGDIDGAIEHYARFAELWEHADANLQPRVESARREIERLTRDRN